MNENTADRWQTARNIVAILVLIIGGLLWLLRLESGQIVNTKRIDLNVAQIERVEKSQNAEYTEIIRRLERLSDKLDEAR